MPIKKPKKIEKDNDNEFHVRYESLVGTRVIEPVLSAELELQVKAAVANYTGQRKWERWGLNTIKKQGSLILLVGPSGTGKTTIARYLAKRIGVGFISLSMADVGSSDPGSTERNINKLFDYLESQQGTTLFLDECDGILFSREKMGPDAMWMLSVVNAILMRVERCKNCVIMATNMVHLLDPALLRRITDIIEVGRPDFETRIKLWEAKIPSEFPFQPDEHQLEKLAQFDLTGAEIENVIVLAAKQAIQQNRFPKFETLCNIAKKTQPETINRKGK